MCRHRGAAPAAAPGAPAHPGCRGGTRGAGHRHPGCRSPAPELAAPDAGRGTRSAATGCRLFAPAQVWAARVPGAAPGAAPGVPRPGCRVGRDAMEIYISSVSRISVAISSSPHQAREQRGKFGAPPPARDLPGRHPGPAPEVPGRHPGPAPRTRGAGLAPEVPAPY